MRLVLLRFPDGQRGHDGRQARRIGLLGPIHLPVMIDKDVRDFQWYVFARFRDGELHPKRRRLINSALVFGDLSQAEVPLVRVHSGCHTGDILGSMRCDCGAQLRESLRKIVEEGCGLLIYMAEHEGRGIGLWAKAMAYSLQDVGYDTYEANKRLGYPPDARDYRDAATVMYYLLRGRKKIRLLSNNPMKKEALERQGFEVSEMISLVAGVNEINRGYLEAKMRFGHRLLPE